MEGRRVGRVDSEVRVEERVSKKIAMRIRKSRAPRSVMGVEITKDKSVGFGEGEDGVEVRRVVRRARRSRRDVDVEDVERSGVVEDRDGEDFEDRMDVVCMDGWMSSVPRQMS